MLDPDDEPTPPSGLVFEPIGRTVRTLRRQIWIGLGLNVLALLGLGFLVLWQTTVLSAWRSRSREIQIEILERVRAHDGIFIQQQSEEPLSKPPRGL